jgi:predicted regulator of Ras-like GTPase activity (Roadblock/LC7/MglB family)
MASGLIGTVWMTRDGLLVGHDLPAGFDPQRIGILGRDMFVSNDDICRKIGSTRLYQFAVLTDTGYLIIGERGNKLAVVVTDIHTAAELLPLMQGDLAFCQ